MERSPGQVRLPAYLMASGEGEPARLLRDGVLGLEVDDRGASFAGLALAPGRWRARVVAHAGAALVSVSGEAEASGEPGAPAFSVPAGGAGRVDVRVRAAEPGGRSVIEAIEFEALGS